MRVQSVLSQQHGSNSKHDAGGVMGSVEGAPAGGSVWRVPGMGWLLGSAMLWFAGFALLIPVVPLWVIRGGSDDLGAGLVTGVMMAGTVLAQLSMRRLLPGLGWRWTLVLGAGLLGLPALGHLATDRLWPVIALAALRGLGFGIVTVCGATAVASFVEPGRRGRALGALGLAIAAPQFILVPVAPWLAERAGFGLVFLLAVLPALAIPLAWPIARAVGDRDRAPDDGSGGGTAAALRRVLAGPIAALVVITAAGGAILTFTSHILASPALGFAGLLAFTGTGAVSRWGAGGVADRFGATPAIAPLLFTGALGLVAIGLRADSVHDSTGRVLVISGLLVVGVAYGGLQNLTLTQAFAVAGEPARDSVSIAWNLSFDAGTGLGAFAVGAIATATSIRSHSPFSRSPPAWWAPGGPSERDPPRHHVHAVGGAEPQQERAGRDGPHGEEPGFVRRRGGYARLGVRLQRPGLRRDDLAEQGTVGDLELDG
jgi:predicted MFS family arabinose efflux permease